MKLRGNPNNDVERELRFQNLVVCSLDAKTLVSFVTCCGVSDLFSRVLHFCF